MARANFDESPAAGSTPSRAELLAEAPALAAWLRSRLLPADVLPPAPNPPGARLAAVLPLLYPRDGVPYLLFTRRSSELTRHRGEISFPGGSRDPGDANSAETALREAWEEIQLPRETVTVLGALSSNFTVVSNFWVTPVVGWLPDGLPPLVPNPAEVAEIIEAPVAALADPAIFHEEIWTREGLPHPVHFYDFGQYRIWGVTAFILSKLLDLLPAD